MKVLYIFLVIVLIVGVSSIFWYPRLERWYRTRHIVGGNGGIGEITYILDKPSSIIGINNIYTDKLTPLTLTISTWDPDVTPHKEVPLLIGKVTAVNGYLSVKDYGDLTTNTLNPPINRAYDKYGFTLDFNKQAAIQVKIQADPGVFVSFNHI